MSGYDAEQYESFLLASKTLLRFSPLNAGQVTNAGTATSGSRCYIIMSLQSMDIRPLAV